MIRKLSRRERLRLMKFVCSFAWADLEVQDEERAFVKQMVSKPALDEQDKQQVAGWLEVPPPPEEVDPSAIPAEHRQLFLDTVRSLVEADNVIAADERENLKLFELLLD